jgi:hypothetical protein
MTQYFKTNCGDVKTLVTPTNAQLNNLYILSIIKVIERV